MPMGRSSQGAGMRLTAEPQELVVFLMTSWLLAVVWLLSIGSLTRSSS